MAQHGDLDVLGVLAAEVSEQHADEPARHEVKEGQGHRPIVPYPGPCCSAHPAEFLNPTGHLTIKMSGHPPFGAQVVLNGHEYVACQARQHWVGFTKDGNCFTGITDTHALAAVADTLSEPDTTGRLAAVCERWIYSACLCFGLSLAEQQQSAFRYEYSVYQAEYSRNLLFGSGAQIDAVWTPGGPHPWAAGRAQAADPVWRQGPPHKDRTSTSGIEAVVETPAMT